MEQEPTKSWTTSAYDRVDREWVHTLNHSYDHTQEFDPAILVRQAPPLKITPTKRKPANSDYQERIIGFGDIHFPFQNQAHLDLAMLAVRETQPDTVVLLGDNLDNAMFSRFETRQEWSDSTKRGIDQYAEFLGQLRADAPQAEIIWHEGNHDVRIEKQIRNYNGELLGIKRAGEALGALSLDFLLRCEELDVEFVKGYPTARRWHGDNFETYHGSVTNSSGFAASKVIQRATTSFMTGHTHQAGIVEKTFKMGREEHTIYGIEAGTFADPSQIPSGSYATSHEGQLRQTQNWQTAVPYILRDEEMVVPYLFPIQHNVIDIFGRKYAS